jgi:hypothetical protein
MKYFETVLKQAKKDKRFGLDAEIGYKNYRCATDGHRIHCLATSHDYGSEAVGLGENGHQPPNVGYFLNEVPSPTHVLRLDPKQAKTFIKLAKLSTFATIPMILEIKGDHVVLSYDSKDGVSWSMDINSHPEQDSIRIPINGKYLADLLEASNHWEFSQAEQGKPIYLKADDKLAVVMPMRG